jgi:hypothetical protein
MRIARLSPREKMMSLVTGSVLALSLSITGCSYHPDLLYVGSDAILEYPFVRSAAASTDYPIVVTTEPSQKDVNVRWTYKGAYRWWDLPFRKASHVQFRLFRTTNEPPLCESPVFKNGETTWRCSLVCDSYIAEPLIGELDHWYGEKGNDDLPETVIRTYYLIKYPK